jgi:hypothetical protein
MISFGAIVDNLGMKKLYTHLLVKLTSELNKHLHKNIFFLILDGKKQEGSPLL